MPAAPVATTSLALSRCGGGVEGHQNTGFGSSSGKAQSWGPGIFRAERDYMAARDLSDFNQLPIRQMEETEAQGEKGEWPRQHSEFFPASRARGVVIRWKVSLEH